MNTERVFAHGDRVRNISPQSQYYQRVGIFQAYWNEAYHFSRGRACDVEYEGTVDLYGRKETAQSVADLEFVEE